MACSGAGVKVRAEALPVASVIEAEAAAVKADLSVWMGVVAEKPFFDWGRLSVDTLPVPFALAVLGFGLVSVEF